MALYPLSFHVNRVHRGWGREIDLHLARRRALPRNEDVHAFNCVISARLDAYPERFFWGGLQSYGDDVESIKAFGLDVVTALCERLIAAGVPALHFYTMNQSATVLEIARRLGLGG